MDFAVQRSADGVRLGLHQAHAKTIADLEICPVLRPELAALLAPLRGMLPSLAGLRKSADLLAAVLPNGIDLLIRADAAATAPDRARLAGFAAAHGIARIAWAVGAGPAENAVLLHPPAIEFAGVQVTPPAGAFLQASAEGEAAITRAVLAGLPAKRSGRASVIELYAGIGTLSFPLGGQARVRAFEGNMAAAAALRRAAGGTRVEAVTRDLARQPLQQAELKDAVAVVLDPPFAGAAAQMPALAASGLPVIYVSCNPAALARDAAVLARAGYQMLAATPIDQFLWSAQVEAVCVFARRAGR
jgi:23S rRNA (uracil1939-C5)-methyltransferase